MIQATCELVWLQHFLLELEFKVLRPIKIICDNQDTLHNASNPILHECTKHIGINYHFLRERFFNKVIETVYVKSEDQLAYIFMYHLGARVLKLFNSKLRTFSLSYSVRLTIAIGKSRLIFWPFSNNLLN